MRKITTELEYRKISEERCKEIDSWEIHDPYGYGTLFTAEKIFFVANKDESVLFCEAFMPKHDDVSLGIKKITYLLFSGSSYYSVEFRCTDVNDSELDGIQYRSMKINIPIQDFIENSKRKEEILELLKMVISIYEKNCSWLKVVREKEYRFAFTYKGEEI